MDQNNDQMIRETYRLTRENNEILRRMRRTAVFWGIIKFLIYAALLAAPIWFYITYLNNTVQTLLQDYNRVQGVNTQAQNQLQVYENAFQQFQARFKTSTTTAQ